MKVKIGKKTYVSLKQPIMLTLTDGEKSAISAMQHGERTIVFSPANTEIEDVRQFMKNEPVETK